MNSHTDEAEVIEVQFRKAVRHNPAETGPGTSEWLGPLDTVESVLGIETTNIRPKKRFLKAVWHSDYR